MEEISELIVELLKMHNRVSLPGMGAFMASPQPAVIDKSAKTVTPPSKKITFSKSETWNDGLLEQLYAERRGMKPDEAREYLRHIITDIRFELDATGKITLPGLGTLKQSPARDINFGLNKNLNLKGDSYGLSEVKIEPGASALKAKKEKNISSDTSSNKNRLLLILLGIMVVVITVLALLFYLGSRSDNGDDWMTPVEVSPVEVQVQQQLPAVPQVVESEVSAPQAEPQRVAQVPQQSPKVKSVAPKKQQVTTPSPSSSRCEYCVVANSFGTYEGAKQKSDSYRKMGYKSEVVSSSNNRYRVTLGCYASNDVAKLEQRKAQKLIRDAWVLEVCR